jgi:hypothetical protein
MRGAEPHAGGGGGAGPAGTSAASDRAAGAPGRSPGAAPAPDGCVRTIAAGIPLLLLRRGARGADVLAERARARHAAAAASEVGAWWRQQLGAHA